MGKQTQMGLRKLKKPPKKTKVLWTDNLKFRVFGSNGRLRLGNEKMLEVSLSSVEHGAGTRCFGGDES